MKNQKQLEFPDFILTPETVLIKCQMKAKSGDLKVEFAPQTSRAASPVRRGSGKDNKVERIALLADFASRNGLALERGEGFPP
ncbi:MAG: hypothetical protein SOT81_04755 [Treponema sp.]|nr:hypothetical protein [Treponema sp.]